MTESDNPDGRAPEKPAGPETPAVSRAFVLGARILLLVAAVLAVTAAGVIMFRDREQTSEVRFSCPMHPDVRTADPAQCPICGMALEPIADNSAMPKGETPGMDDMSAVENVRKHKILDFVRVRSLPLNVREIHGAAWVENDGFVTALFYRDQVNAMTPDERATFSSAQNSVERVALQRTADDAVPRDRSTFAIRFRMDSETSRATPNAPSPSEARPSETRKDLTPGWVGWVEIAPKARSVLTVPAAAVIQSPEGPYVLRLAKGFQFEKRPIEVGETFLKQGIAVVLSGLAAQDRVVAKATFFLDADRRLGSHAGEEDWGRE